MLLGIVAGAIVLRIVASRFVRTEGPPGWPLGAESREEFWRMTLPWPRGVQEDDEIAWHVPKRESPDGPASSSSVGGPITPSRPVPPTAPQRRVVGR
jgi:hypothetical protein